MPPLTVHPNSMKPQNQVQVASDAAENISGSTSFIRGQLHPCVFRWVTVITADLKVTVKSQVPP